MNTDKLAIKDDQPSANSTVAAIAEEGPATAGNGEQDVTTIFDVTNEIEESLRKLEEKSKKNDKQFYKSLDILEEKLSQLKD